MSAMDDLQLALSSALSDMELAKDAVLTSAQRLANAQFQLAVKKVRADELSEMIEVMHAYYANREKEEEKVDG